uniref:ATP synthase subunit 9, mitochondrial n=27 Tax=Caryophyllales TaxID=3524 RepID=A0A803N8X9_CHEQI
MIDSVMLEGAKLMGAGAATIASAGAAIGIGNVFSSLIHSVARNPSLAKQLFGYAILGFALTEAIALFALMMAFLISFGEGSEKTFLAFSGKKAGGNERSESKASSCGGSVAGFFGRFLGSEGTAIVTTTCVSFSSILSLIAFYEVAPGASACYLRIAPWISSEMFDASWGFFGDREVTG